MSAERLVMLRYAIPDTISFDHREECKKLGTINREGLL